MLASVVTAKDFPRMKKPRASIRMLNARTNQEIGRPVRWLTVSAIPVVPPVTRPAGSRKSLTVRAYRKFPMITDMSDKNVFIIICSSHKKYACQGFSLTDVDQGISPNTVSMI